MASVAEAARDAGAEVWTIAPSWKAVEVIRSDTETAEEMARAVAGFLDRVRRGEIQLNRNSVIVTDEAGMIGTKDMATLVAVASQAGAKLVLTGDTRQLAPVAAGAPMRALVRALGTSRMEEIQRQKGRTPEEGAWMRAASMDFARGAITSALEAYDRAGAVTWAEDRDAAVAALVRDYVADRQQAPAKTRAVLTGWNVDVGEINRRIRAALIAQGTLPDGRDVQIRALSRGSTKPIALALAPDDDVIFGETVEVRGHTIRNADLARIEHIDTAQDGDQILTFRLAKNGAVITAKTSELVGFREKGAAKVPKLQHSYAMTVHAAQGVTVDQCYVANFRGLRAENTYVAMTRHRESVRLYTDTSRVRDQIEARHPGVAPEERGLSGRVERAPEIGLADIRKALIEESTTSSRKANVIDFLPEGTDLRSWASEPPAASAQGDAPETLIEHLKVDQPLAPVAAVERHELSLPPSTPLRPARTAGRLTTPLGRSLNASVQPLDVSAYSQERTEALRKRMLVRTKATVAYPVPDRRDVHDSFLALRVVKYIREVIGLRSSFIDQHQDKYFRDLNNKAKDSNTENYICTDKKIKNWLNEKQNTVDNTRPSTGLILR